MSACTAPPQEENNGESAIMRLLAEVRAEVPGAREKLFAELYAELHRCAVAHMERQPVGHTLQATALVNELFSRLRGDGAGPWNDREHFLRVASTAMHQILVDYARGKRTKKRHAQREDLFLDRILAPFEERDIDIDALDRVLKDLRRMDAPMADAALLLIYTPATVEEASKAAGLSLRSFERRWQATRAWILEQLS